MSWGAASPNRSTCPTGEPRPEYTQRLVWTEGPLAGSYVHDSQFAGSPGPGDPVPGGPPGAVFAADGYVYRFVCAAVEVTDDVWVEAVRRMTPVDLEKSPGVRGLTGVETWVWYSGQVQVEPFQLDWIDPVTAVPWVLEARAWVGELAWSFGDGQAERVVVGVFDDAPASAGTQASPAGAHVYETSSAEAGYVDGYPFDFAATWQGEYRWSADGGSTWSPWVPMTNSFTDTVALTYEVAQVRSALTGSG